MFLKEDYVNLVRDTQLNKHDIRLLKRIAEARKNGSTFYWGLMNKGAKERFLSIKRKIGETIKKDFFNGDELAHEKTPDFLNMVLEVIDFYKYEYKGNIK